MRQKINLNFSWRFNHTFSEEHVKNNCDESNFEIINIPHSNVELPYNYIDETVYQKVTCYRKRFFLPNEYLEKRIIITFEGVAHVAEIYMNEKFVGEHKGGYTAFSFDITPFVKIGEENLIVVKVDAREREDIPPFGHVIDYLTYGGIYREVFLEVVSPLYISQLKIETTDVCKKEKKVQLLLQVQGDRKERTCVIASIFDKKNKLIHTSTLNLDIENEKIIDMIVKDVQLWDIENPNLYTMKIELWADNLLDEVIETFGFRECSFRSNGFYLNNKKLKLVGLNRHQAYPYVGYAMPKSAQVEDVYILKYKLGVNIVRTSHYPQSKHFIRACDELGILVFTEIPGWQHISQRDDWRHLVLQHVEEMVTQYWNHPSIILWGVRINESQDDDALYEKTNHVAKILDKTRQTGGVRYITNSHLIEDVYTFNDFLHSGKNAPLRKRNKVTKAKVPYLVTEFNGHMYPTKSFDQESKRLEHALRHIRVLDAMFGDEEISGAIGWCMTDYNTHKDFGSGDSICYHGVLDMFRISKLASYAYSIQNNQEPILQLSSTMNMGDYDGSFIGRVYAFTNCDYIELYKNDQYIQRFSLKSDEFSSIPYPPILVDDFIGNCMYVNENISKKTATLLKEVFMEISKYGIDNLPLKVKTKMAYLLATRKVSLNQGMQLYGKYIGNWGEESVTYRFDGYKDGVKVISKTQAPVQSSYLRINYDNHILTEALTYDVKRIEIQHLCQNGNVLVYSNEVVHVRVSGPIEVIGPTTFALIGGVRAFWIKSLGIEGNCEISIKRGCEEGYTIPITIKKSSKEKKI